MRKFFGLVIGCSLAAALFWTLGGDVEAQAPGGSPAVIQSAAIDRDAATLRLTLGVGDAEPADWSGTVGAVSWTLRTGRARTKKGQPPGPVVAATTEQTVGRGARTKVATEQGDFELDTAAMAYGRPASFLDGRVQAEKLPASFGLANGPLSEAYPAVAAAPDGTLWAAYVRYDPGTPTDPQATGRAEFDSLVPDDNGDQIVLLRFDGEAFSFAANVTEEGRDVWRPTVVADAEGKVWTVWSEKRTGDWELLARRFDPETGQLGVERRLTAVPGADINPVAARDADGKMWVAWQSWRTDGNVAGFEILLGELTGAELNPSVVSASRANDWNPAIAADLDGGVWVAWDTYDKGDYDVYARRFANNRPQTEAIAVAASARFEARASVAVDSGGRVWVAYEDADEEWGKDYGDRWPGRQATSFYEDRWIKVRVIANGRVLQTAADFQTPFIEDYRDDPMKPSVFHHRTSMPRLTLDREGRAWLLFRRHPGLRGLGERWASYATYYEGGAWSPQIALPHSMGLIDNRPALAAVDGGLMVIHSTDQRVERVNDAKDGDLYAAWLEVEGRVQPPLLREVDPRSTRRPMVPIHPNEAADVARMRAERIEVGGKAYRYMRGEFHRHTEISSHRDWDGPLEEVFRYGLDVAAMDWIGPGDHDYGRENEYLWWYTQKLVDIYYHPGRFLPMFTYERSQRYPSGHRNVIFAQRGIRPLPRLPSREQQFGTYEDGSADIRNLYAYLRTFAGICSSHTSATNMGNDWRDADAEVEPVVEIFQGHRQSYEETNAPLAARGPDDAIQGYRPLGFVWEAFKRGRKLGFQASSDHISTHLSYAIAIVEDPTREGLIAAFKKRHSYAAHDNILLDVRSGDHMMGDEFASDQPPRIDIRVAGTTTVETIDIVRQIELGEPEYVARFEPGEVKVDLSWTDRDAAPGKVNMYYVRVRQANEALAWASPMWIRYR